MKKKKIFVFFCQFVDGKQRNGNVLQIRTIIFLGIDLRVNQESILHRLVLPGRYNVIINENDDRIIRQPENS
jgi:hypothetical protein